MILIMIEGWDKNAEEVRQVKLAALASGQHEIGDVFPEYRTTQDEQQGMGDNPETAYDYSGVEFESPGEENFEALLAQLQDASISVSGAEAGEYDTDDNEGEWL